MAQLPRAFCRLRRRHPGRFLSLFSTAQGNTNEHLNIGTVGDESHGKSTLCRAILKTLDANHALHGTNEDKLGQSRSIDSGTACSRTSTARPRR